MPVITAILYKLKYNEYVYTIDNISYSFKHKHHRIHAKKYLLSFSKQFYKFLKLLNLERRKNPLLNSYQYKYFSYSDNTITYDGTMPNQ